MLDVSGELIFLSIIFFIILILLLLICLGTYSIYLSLYTLYSNEIAIFHGFLIALSPPGNLKYSKCPILLYIFLLHTKNSPPHIFLSSPYPVPS